MKKLICFKGRKDKIKRAWILGSNSGVAKSICEELAKLGCNYFFLISKDKKKGEEFADYLRVKFNISVIFQSHNLLDDCNSDIMQRLISENFDLYLITAGYLGANSLAEQDEGEAMKIFKINFINITKWINLITSNKRIDEKGRLWVFTSVAGDRGKPSNYFYGSAKSGLETFCEGVLLKCNKKPFSVRIIKAGYMNTKMAINIVPKFLCTDTKFIAKKLMKNIDKSGIEYSPYWWQFIMFMIKILPKSVVSRL